MTVPVAGRDQAFAVRRICVGRNYIEHIREMKEGDERDPPFFFQKPTDAIVTDGRVPYPVLTEDFQFELELVIAIGRTPDPDPTQSLSAVFGYAVGLDLTRRDRQREAFREGRPWEVGKSFDASAPCGPILPVEAGGLRAGRALDAGSQRPGRAQQSELGKMIWNVPEIIVQLSRQYRLMPGDMIFTGTPAGVATVQLGDRQRGRVAALPELDVTIVAGR